MTKEAPSLTSNIDNFTMRANSSFRSSERPIIPANTIDMIVMTQIKSEERRHEAALLEAPIDVIRPPFTQFANSAEIFDGSKMAPLILDTPKVAA